MPSRKILKIKDLEKEKTTQEVVAFLIDNKSFSEEDAEKEAEKIVAKCIKGWNKSPDSLKERIDVKLEKTSIKLKKRKIVEIEATEIKNVTPFIDAICTKYSFDDPVEKKSLRSSLKAYAKTFDIDNPADWSILENLLVDSLALTRANKAYMDINNGLSETDMKALEIRREKLSTRIMEWQKTLGIDRKSRDDELNKQAKDIASLSKALSAKLEELDAEEVRDLEEELMYNRERLSREPVNLPKNVDQMVRILETNEGQVDPDLQNVIEERKDRLVKREFLKEKEQKEHIIDLPIGDKIG